VPFNHISADSPTTYILRNRRCQPHAIILQYGKRCGGLLRRASAAPCSAASSCRRVSAEGSGRGLASSDAHPLVMGPAAEEKRAGPSGVPARGETSGARCRGINTLGDTSAESGTSSLYSSLLRTLISSTRPSSDVRACVPVLPYAGLHSGKTPSD
jgi:hypothetical protein